MPKPHDIYFVTGIGTDVGKTVLSAILTEALEADYLKLVQSGTERDTPWVQSMIGNATSAFLPERYAFPDPLSPHAAASRAGVIVDKKELEVKTPLQNSLVVEGAGGLMVPIAMDYLFSDWVVEHRSRIKVIVVSRHYLGSINHTLLTLQALEALGVSLFGLVYNGSPDLHTEKAIAHQFPDAHLLGRILPEKSWNTQTISNYAAFFKKAVLKRKRTYAS